MLRLKVTLLVSLTLAFAASSAHAASASAQKCQAGKNKAAGKYAACRENAEAKLATSGDTAKYGEAITKCSDKFAATWQKLEDKAVAAGSSCPSVGDATGIGGKVTATTDTIAALVGGVRFEDNGDGTVTDHQTGLQWEKKTTTVDSGQNYADPHDVDNYYTWSVSGDPYPPDGTAYTDFLSKLNDCSSPDGTTVTGGFANHCDWRLPTIVELQTIVDSTQGNCGGGSGACIDPVFGPTIEGWYWSSTTDADSPYYAWFVHSDDGNADSSNKNNVFSVRAVRTGS